MNTRTHRLHFVINMTSDVQGLKQRSKVCDAKQNGLKNDRRIDQRLRLVVIALDWFIV